MGSGGRLLPPEFRMTTPKEPSANTSEKEALDFAALKEMMQHAPGSVSGLTPVSERPLYGITLYIANCTVDTVFGKFKAFIFQDMIHKGYLIALTFGDIVSAVELPMRIHSSCVTSETLRGCDCDCVQQLEGALDVIAKKGRGILIYLMQEGRGVGFVAKARDRMLVQASLDHISTFQAYRCMGLKKDHRSYENVSHICYLLGIKAGFTLLTNNPDKVSAIEGQGLKVLGTETLEFEPSPFNLTYLTSKAAAGHILNHPQNSLVRSARPPESVIPFKPHVLSNSQRFIYSASYFLPMRPVDDEVILARDQFDGLCKTCSIQQYMDGTDPLILNVEPLRDERYAVRINSRNLSTFRCKHPDDSVGDLLTTPYWFRVHVYYDIVNSQESVALTYGTPKIDDIPVVRLQSESLFNRFPLLVADNREKFKLSVRNIVRYGTGVIILLYYDGRGAGFGAYAADQMMTEIGMSHSSDESYQKLGVGYDSRDYEASILLLKHHVTNEKIQMVMNSPSSLVRKTEYASALNDHRIDVENWIFLEDKAVDK
jgi:3,4-dihydroxy 2-butanone 4-phosphate synthase/GTP cyclohydrolase II